MKVLLAEDERIERDGLRFMLEKAYGDRVEILEAKNGEEAVRSAETENPEIIFMDIQMPILDGLEACRRIRQRDKEVILVIITAYSLFEYAKEAISYQVRAYLVKPYSAHALREIMDPLLGIMPGDVKEYREMAAEPGMVEDEVVMAVKAYVAGHYAEEITLTVLEEKLMRSRFVISRVFNESEKETIREYINRVRISHAISLMKEGKNVSEAAYAVGFREPTHFSKVFKKLIGVSPSGYMTERQNP